MRRWFAIVSLLVMWGVPGRAQEVESVPGDDLVEDLVREALDASPSMESLRLRIEALQRQSDQAGARPEPTLAVEYSNMPVTTPWPGNHPMSGLQLRLQQTVLFPGTLRQRVSAAQARELMGEASYDQGRVVLAAAVRRTYWQLALTRQLRSDHEAAQDDIRADLDSTLARWERAADKATTYHDQLIPDARTTLEATLAAYQVGRADYASLFQAEVQLLDLERAARMAEADAALAETDALMTLGTAERTPRGDRRWRPPA
jgi:outer membrane protein TolC